MSYVQKVNDKVSKGDLHENVLGLVCVDCLISLFLFHGFPCVDFLLSCRFL